MPQDDLNPTGPAQPGLDQVYETTGNAATKEPAEQQRAAANASDNSKVTDQRIPQTQTSSQSEATPSSLGRGIRGAGPGEPTTHESAGRNQELEADQMAAPGEGKIASAVENHPGAGPGAPGLETDLERKKAEQAPARAEVQKEEREEFDVGGVLGQRGGPANPVDKGGYPN